VRRAGWRIAERWLASAEREAFSGIFSEQFATESPEVLAQAVLSWSTAVGAEQARPAIHAALPRAAEHPALLDAVALAMRGDEIAAFEHLLMSARGPLPPFGHRALFRSLAETMVANGASGQTKLIEALLDVRVAESVRLALMQGVSATGDAGKGRRAPGTGRMAPAALERLEREAPDPAVRRGAGVLLNELRQEQARVARRGKAAPLTALQQASFDLGKTHYLLCAGCHQPDGEGKDGVAPSLRQARWATHASPDFAIRIVLSGKEGTPGYPGAMVPMGGLSDEQISSILTYVRRSWGNEASAVSPAEVAQVRATVAGRTATWTDSDLEKLEREGAKP
jgi:mono/diheme cytochrome c family protein